MSLPPPPSAPPFSVGGAQAVGAHWTAPVQARRPLPQHGLTTALTVLLGAVGLVCIGLVVILLDRADVGRRFLDGETSYLAVDRANQAVMGAMVVYYLVVAATGVVFVVWQYRHARNAEILAGPARSGWARAGRSAVGAWAWRS